MIDPLTILHYFQPQLVEHCRARQCLNSAEKVIDIQDEEERLQARALKNTTVNSFIEHVSYSIKYCKISLLICLGSTVAFQTPVVFYYSSGNNFLDRSEL